MPLLTDTAAPADLMCRCEGWSWSWLVPLRNKEVATSKVTTPSGLHCSAVSQRGQPEIDTPAFRCATIDIT